MLLLTNNEYIINENYTFFICFESILIIRQTNFFEGEESVLCVSPFLLR